MARGVALPKGPGCGGSAFEDKVAAYFLSLLLGGRPALGPAIAAIVRLDFQTRADGWLLDDLLVTLSLYGLTRRCAFSIRSCQHLTKSGAPRDFGSVAWSQFLQN